MSKERWLPVVGLESYFRVSDEGNICWRSGESLPSYVANKLGHRRVFFGIGKRRQQYVHRVVLEAFVGPCPPGMQCRHLNGVADDNRLVNLVWGTASEDNYDRVRHGTHQHSKRTHCPKGHPLDAVKYHADGTFWQRRCRTCLREQNRARRARKTHCPQGHPFDGFRYRADGSVRQRYCTVCARAKRGVRHV